MKILAIKPAHDSNAAYISDGELVYSYEAEKGSHPRFEKLTQSLILDFLESTPDVPDVIAMSGWASPDSRIANYWGTEEETIVEATTKVFGKQVKYFSSSHERSHIFMSYGMSDLPQGTPCYILNWEGGFGDFYEIDSRLNIIHLGKVMSQPGGRYAFLYSIADKLDHGPYHLSAAGKLMALASYSTRSQPTADEERIINRIMAEFEDGKSTRADFRESKFFRIGVEHPDFKELAGKHSDRIFSSFYEFAERNLTKKLPLLIGGGCGLNCEWNTLWRDSGLFSEVFVPPCTNDSGAAIGTAIDAQFRYTGNAKLKWNVYSGQSFDFDCEPNPDNWEVKELDYRELATKLANGAIIGWVQGRTEIGPRALGNRSILAAPFDPAMRDRLNILKHRAGYRPVAPICLEEEVSNYFEWEGPSPYMLYFQKVKHPLLGAVTHIDGTARVQTVNKLQNERIYQLLTAFREVSGVGVLCNTSLNYKGKGFINGMNDLLLFQKERRLDALVVEDKLLIPRSS